jgi:hypothetical protein
VTSKVRRCASFDVGTALEACSNDRQLGRGAGGRPARQPGLLATERTALLVAGILTIAIASRAAALVEGAWLVYPLLVLTGLKFVLEDLRAGQPGTLFVGFALFGLALIAGPRLCRRPGIDASVAEPGRPAG